MKPEIDRLKSDLETMQKALGLPCFRREWIQWLKRDSWLNLWWCVPGVILIASALVPFDEARRYLGLAATQWAGVFVSFVLLGMLFFWGKMTNNGARPAEVVREYKRMNAYGSAFLPGFVAQFALYLAWSRQYDIGGAAFMAGLWILSGGSVLMLAVTTKAWVLLGWAIPLVAFGFCQPLVQEKSGGLWLGLMFIVAALLCSFIQVWQFRGMEKQHD